MPTVLTVALVGPHRAIKARSTAGNVYEFVRRLPMEVPPEDRDWFDILSRDIHFRVIKEVPVEEPAPVVELEPELPATDTPPAARTSES